METSVPESLFNKITGQEVWFSGLLGQGLQINAELLLENFY